MIKKNGFTIIETLVAIGIFGIGILALAGYYAFTAHTQQLARQITTATNLAQGILDKSIAEGYDSIIIGTGEKENYSSDLNNPYQGYQKQINVSLVDSNLNQSTIDLGLKKIDCFVYWETAGQPKRVQVTTIISTK